MADENRESSPDGGLGSSIDPTLRDTVSDDDLLDKAWDETGRGEKAERPRKRDSRPASIGQYRILSVLGMGGMGTVYEAEQQRPRRAVALKVVRGGCHVDEHSVRLFQREAQTLARLKHPGIAAIYEAGCTEDGQHFFAMELVRGVAMHKSVRTARPKLRERLEMFRKICDAINYAHQRGVIHRDLKPSNILIDSEGQPKILDFGLAKITDVDIAAATVVTEVGRIQGTLAYMSPEQARGNPDEIDLRSDVYSLGVILYELLTDRLPYSVGESALHETVRAICEDEPPRPSNFSRALRGDLDTIILKALDKEPSRRYQSAAALSEDVERHLTHQPIFAQPPGTVYQLRKLITRHKAPFAFVAVLFILVAGFGVWMRVLYRAEQEQRMLADQHRLRAEEAEKQAEGEALAAREVSDFLTGMFILSDPNEAVGDKITAREILDRGARRIETELRDEPATQATLMTTMGIVYRNLGVYGPATALLEQALRIRRAEFGEEHGSVAESLFNLGWLYRIKGDYEAAEPLVADALAIRRKLLGPRHPEVAETLVILAGVKRYRANYESAEALIREALAIQRDRLEVLEDGDDKKKTIDEIAGCLETLGEILEEEGEYAKSEEACLEGLKLRRELLGDDHPYVASTLEALAAALRGQGDYAGAEKLIREALSIYRNKMGDEHPFISLVSTSLGAVLRDQGKLEAAEPPLRAAVEMSRRRTAYDHPYVPKSKSNLAWLLFDAGDYVEAEALFREVLTFYRLRVGSEHPRVADTLVGLARVRQARGDVRQAESMLREALAIYYSALPARHWSTASAESALGGCLAAMGSYAEAEQLLVPAYKVMTARRGPDDRYVREARERIVELYRKWDKPDKLAAYEAADPAQNPPRRTGRPE